MIASIMYEERTIAAWFYDKGWIHCGLMEEEVGFFLGYFRLDHNNGGDYEKDMKTALGFMSAWEDEFGGGGCCLVTDSFEGRE